MERTLETDSGRPTDDYDADDGEQPSGEDRESAIEAMREWFYERFEDPVHSLPYESREGGYQWMGNGPYDARDQLGAEFGGAHPDSWIEELASELDSESPQWVRRPYFDESDDEVDEEPRSQDDERSGLDPDTAAQVGERLDEIIQLLDADPEIEPALKSDIHHRIEELRALFSDLGKPGYVIGAEEAATWKAVADWLRQHAPRWVSDKIAGLFLLEGVKRAISMVFERLFS